MPTSAWDVIVLGAGGVGSAAAWRLAARGARVLGLDRHHPPHAHGSSHGQTRAIRMAYFEHPDYVPLLRRAYALWSELEQQLERTLFVRCGLLEVGPADGVLVPGVLRSATAHALAVDRLTAVEARREFPAFHVPDNDIALFERDAGFLQVEACVQAQLEAARLAGATFHGGVEAFDWTTDGSGFRVRTSDSIYHSQHLVIAAGGWSRNLLPWLPIPLRVIRKPVYFFPETPEVYRCESGCPVYFFETPNGFYYGFPALDARGLKVGCHSGEGPEFDVPDPTAAAGGLAELPHDRAGVQEFLRHYLPRMKPHDGPRSDCWYTMTPDEHFIVDARSCPGRLAYAAGLSGHGFKFATVLGEILADLALDGSTSLPIHFLRADRPSATV